MTRRHALLALLALFASVLPLSAQPPRDAGRYEFRKEHDPNGTGKFYMGREIALVMGHEAAGWLDRPEREQEEQPTRMLDALKLKPGDVVADIGAGSGYHTFRMSERVGPTGKVYAVDIQPEMLALIRQRAKARNLTNIEPVLGTEDDPKLPPNSVDLILMVDVYHEFFYPWEMTVNMLKALKPGGRLVFVEFRLEDPDVPIKLVHKMTEKQVRKEMEPHPVRWIETIGILPWQHIVVFKKNDTSAQKKTRILLIGKDRDHAFTTHEYMADCELLARCLKQTPNVETVVSNGWPKDPSALKDVDAIVLYTANGGDVLLKGLHRAEAEALLKRGVGLTAIHWSTGASEGDVGEAYLRTLGGWFNTKFSRYLVRETKLTQADPTHPVCRGWKDYMLRDEYYIQLKYLPEAKPIMTVKIDDKEHVVGWVHERPGSEGGRSFGFVCGHFHANFGEKAFRQAIVNGILWTAHRPVPDGGAPSEITAKDMELPPDTRPKKQ